jgi:hypothetical protein
MNADFGTSLYLDRTEPILVGVTCSIVMNWPESHAKGTSRCEQNRRRAAREAPMSPALVCRMSMKFPANR